MIDIAGIIPVHRPGGRHRTIHHHRRRMHMPRLAACGIATLSLAIAAGCADDASSREPVAPAAADQAIAADRGGHDDNHSSGRSHIAIRDDCDPRDPAWIPTGGCLLRRGDVTLAEFNEEASSPLAVSVVGHQAWRNDPSYLEITTRGRVRVRNEGGRVHTFTEVAEFGGGKVPSPLLNQGLTPAPECAASVDIAPGRTMEISRLDARNHRFQCCIHPWMRALVKVHPERDRGDR
jgi:hypothetical protein